ncbi:hypothetical protein [Nonomuraea sp. NPDC003214]
MKVWILEYGDDESQRRVGIYANTSDPDTIPAAAQRAFEEETRLWLRGDHTTSNEDGMQIARRGTDWVALQPETIHLGT